MNEAEAPSVHDWVGKTIPADSSHRQDQTVGPTVESLEDQPSRKRARAFIYPEAAYPEQVHGGLL